MKDNTVHQSLTLQALVDISKYISTSLDYQEIAVNCLKSLSHNLDLENCALLTPSSDKKNLEIGVGIKWNQSEKENFSRPLQSSPLGRVYSSGMTLAVPRVDDIPDLYVPESLKQNYSLIGFLAVPVLVNRIPIGVLAAYRTSNRTMLDEDVNLLKIVASILSQTMKLADLVDQKNQHLISENEKLQVELEDRFQVDNLVTTSGAMDKTLSMVKRVSPTDATVLLRGESGTGKTMIAQGIHFSSLRRKKPLVVVNCAALPSNLIESELFGHEKGAFTGAISKRIGKFEAAEKGTLFLDEIGELPLDVQAKILRVIQDGHFEKVGSNKTQVADVRIICATNINLEQAVKQKQFREDLYYRLMVVPLYIPSLRTRREDILPLVAHFLQRYNRKYNKQVVVTREGLHFLERQNWKGNVRELEHAIERTVILSPDDTPVNEIPLLDLQELEIPSEPDFSSSSSRSLENHPETGQGRVLYERVPLRESQVITALEESVGIQTVAAKKLGVSLRQLRYAIKKMDLDIRTFKY